MSCKIKIHLLTRMKENIDYEKWLRQRSITVKIFCLVNFALGIERSIVYGTLYLYLKDVLHVKEYLNTFYSTISGIYLISQIISSLVFCRIFDKYRCLKLMFFIANALTFTGNVLYTIPFSPWFLFTGRLVSGVGGFLRPIIISELTRSFPGKQLLSQMSASSLSFAVGFAVGPLFSPNLIYGSLASILDTQMHVDLCSHSHSY